MNKDISLLRCNEEKQSGMGGKKYSALNGPKVNFGDFYSLISKNTLSWDYKPCRRAAISPNRLMLFVRIFTSAGASTQYQNLKGER